MTDRPTWLRVPGEAELPPEVLELWQASLEKLGFVPNVLRFYALRPSRLLAWNAHYDETMKGYSTLTKAEREMIAVAVSVANSCAYCIGAHSAALRKLTKDPPLADQIATDHAQAGISDRDESRARLRPEADPLTGRDGGGGRRAPARRGLEGRGRDGYHRGHGTLQLLERMASGLGW